MRPDNPGKPCSSQNPKAAINRRTPNQRISLMLKSSRITHYPLLLSAAAFLFFTNLGGASLWDVDEGRNATAAWEMYESGKYIVPTFNGKLRVDKPALLYWLQAGAYAMFGVNETAARLPSAL